ncbi:hypothetical protein CRI94_16910 [Longibacter salinarum]|uniref:Uncharacterized protein n=1 Tax=Longibacter salinarum TaxID=1850348 RepID=A0A2A8CTN3_9BACT|nr:hypothetical protein [Longibacter salinarum]PEN11101.1 hypothetical protein CRI94_16910 [Longibacter salinarum]
MLITGCGDATSGGGPSTFTPPNAPSPPSADERDRAIAVLDSMKRTVFDSAFVHLRDYAFTRSVRTERIDSNDGVSAFRERTLRYRPNGDASPFQITLVDSDSSGSFDASVLGRFGPSPDPSGVPVDLASEAFPDDPPYLSARKREAFQYNVRSDTYEGAPALIVTVQARESGTGPDQVARYAELTVHGDSYELLAAHTVYTERTLLYGQDTVFHITLARTENDTWLPKETRFRAILDMVLRDPFHVRTESTYTDVRS